MIGSSSVRHQRGKSILNAEKLSENKISVALFGAGMMALHHAKADTEGFVLLAREGEDPEKNTLIIQLIILISIVISIICVALLLT